MANPQGSLEFRITGDTEPLVNRLYIALFPIGSGSVCHWGLVLRDTTGTTDLLDINDLGGSWTREIRDFDAVRKNHLKVICEIADLEKEGDEKNVDEAVRLVRSTAASEETLTSRDGSIGCRAWVINVLKSLWGKRVKLYGDPESIQKAARRTAGEFEMRYGDEYHVASPILDADGRVEPSGLDEDRDRPEQLG